MSALASSVITAVTTPRRAGGAGAPSRRRVPRSAAPDTTTATAPPSLPLTASVLRATAVSVPPDATLPLPAEDGEEEVGAAPVGRPRGTSPLLHRIPRSRWPNGVPAVMGAHLLSSHMVAPLSVSKGESGRRGGGMRVGCRHASGPTVASTHARAWFLPPPSPATALLS